MTARPVPDHGTEARYQGNAKRPPCHCPTCTRGAGQAVAARKADRLAGRPRTIDAAPAKARIRALLDIGVTLDEIAERCGLPSATVRNTLYREKVRRGTAEAVLDGTDGWRPRPRTVRAAGPAALVQRLYAQGHGPKRVAAVSGVDRYTIINLARGRRTTVTVRTAAAVRRAYDLLNGTPGSSSRARQEAIREGWVRDAGLVDATGTLRRLRALQVIGYTRPAIAHRTGVAERRLRAVFQGQPLVRPEDARRVKAAYGSMILAFGGSTETARRARKDGWHGPAAWDDIDNPAAEPETCGTTARKTIRDRARERAEEIQHLAGFGLSDHAIAEQLGMSPKYVHDLLAGHRITGQRELRKAA
jgi:transcriptional regulator with XRE-family HTH domain/AraC-like DNA-binding protein